MGGVTLNFHSAAAAVSLLPPPEFAVHEFLRDLKPSRHSREKGDQSLAMRLPRGEVFKHFFGIVADSPGKPGVPSLI